MRLAAAALGRVFPLEPVGAATVRSARELARARGLDPIDPAAAAVQVTAALNRDPSITAAVQEALRRRRDQAAAQLAYEVAARMAAEGEALAWVLADQKATVPEPVDEDVHGWAAGTLVTYQIRGGRLSSWTHERSGRDDAEPLVAATPPRWRAFARRNAVLAAALCSAAGP